MDHLSALSQLLKQQQTALARCSKEHVEGYLATAQVIAEKEKPAKSVYDHVPDLTWPCIVIMKAVLERVQTKM